MNIGCVLRRKAEWGSRRWGKITRVFDTKMSLIMHPITDIYFVLDLPSPHRLESLNRCTYEAQGYPRSQILRPSHFVALCMSLYKPSKVGLRRTTSTHRQEETASLSFRASYTLSSWQSLDSESIRGHVSREALVQMTLSS
jgi:hypothetical protein